ncbi:cation diffusion facilitator family transporter [Georgenia muralis]
MGAGHSHGPAPVPGHAGGRYRRRLAGAFALTATFLVVELVAGLLSGSLALISDAGHMAADVVALGAALLATRIAVRPDTTGRRTYGSYRAEVFASGLTVLIMLGVGVYVLVEAVSRVGAAPQVTSGTMLAVGLIGLVINVVSLLLLRGGSQESLNVKGAYFEVVADAAGSVGVMVAGVLIMTTGQPIWDVVIAALIAVFVVLRALSLGRQVLTVLGQHAPAGIDPEAVATTLGEVAGVAEIHDLHLWTLTSGMNVATAHLVALPGADRDAVLGGARDVLRDRYGIEHATLQVERDELGSCQDLTW